MTDRIIRAGILTSDQVCSLSWAEEVFFRRLMSVVDDYGRFDGRLGVLKAALYPLQLEKVTDADVGKWRLATAKAGLVSVYAVAGKEYVQIEKFNQRIQGRAKWPDRNGLYEPGPDRGGRKSTVMHGDAPCKTVMHGLYGYGDGDEKHLGQERKLPRLVVGNRGAREDS